MAALSPVLRLLRMRATPALAVEGARAKRERSARTNPPPAATANTDSAFKMRDAGALLKERAPGLEVEGEMHADAALDEAVRLRIFPNSRLQGPANLLILPNLEAANNAFNLLKAIGDGLPIGPILVGAAQSAHVLTPSVSALGIVNMSALAFVDAQSREAVGG